MGKKKQKRISTSINTSTDSKINNNTENKPQIDLLEILGGNTKWLAVGLIIFISFIVFSDFILLEKIYFFKDIGSDSLNSSYPNISHNSRYLRDFGIPTWSFELGMGQNLFPIFLYDPLDIFLYPFGLENIQYLVIFKLIFELVLSGLAFYFFLKMLNLSNYTSLIGALVYAFSGFMIVSSGWYIFPAEVITMPFILIGIEMIRNKKKYWILAIPIFYLVLTRPFVLGTLTPFIFSYITLRHLQNQIFNLKNYLSQLFLVAIISAIGIIMAAPFLLEHLKMMIESPRGSGVNSLTQELLSTPIFKITDKLELITSLYRTYASDLLGSGNNFKGWMNIFEAPQFYSGIICLTLIPHLFYLSTKRERIAFGIFFSFWLLPVFFPFFRYALSFFTGNYYRSLSLYISLSLTLLALFGLEKILKTNKINKNLLIAWSLMLIILLIFPFYDIPNFKNNGLVFFAIICIATYSFLLLKISKNDINSKYFILLLIVVELIINSSTSVNNRDILTSKELDDKKGYNDYSNEALTKIKTQDSGFFRIDKRFSSTPAMHTSLNDGMVQGYYGTSAYFSFNQKYYIQYLKLMGIIPENNETATRWSQGLRSRMLLERLNSVKYLLAFPGDVDQMTKLLYDSIGIANNIVILKNKFPLPLGFAYSKIYPLENFRKLSDYNKDFVSYNAAIVNEKDIEFIKGIDNFPLNDTLTEQNFSLSDLDSLSNNLASQSFSISSFKPSDIKGNIALKIPGVVYFSIPYDEGWHISVDNQPTKPIILSDGMLGLILKEGKHEVELKYILPYAGIGLKISIIGFLAFGFLIWYTIKKRKDSIESKIEPQPPTSSTT